MDELTLEITEGPDAGRQAELAGTFTIGRAPEADMSLPDTKISRIHVRVTARDGYAIVEDFGSANGTFINREQVVAPTRLNPGDQLHIGETVLLLRRVEDIATRKTSVRSVPPWLASHPPRTPD